MQSFILNYVTEIHSTQRMDEIILEFINYIMQNFEAKKWFYDQLYKLIVNQFQNSEIEDEIRLRRVQLLWEVFKEDPDKREEVLEMILCIFKRDCQDQEDEFCRSLFTSCPLPLRDVVYKILLNANINGDTMKRFLNSG